MAANRPGTSAGRVQLPAGVPLDDLPLGDVPLGSTVVLVRSHDAPARALRLAELGLRVGAQVSVVARTAGGGRMLGVGHARIAIGPELAARLRVRWAAR
jgi:Fe2+ transport system protein FeoA